MPTLRQILSYMLLCLSSFALGAVALKFSYIIPLQQAYIDVASTPYRLWYWPAVHATAIDWLTLLLWLVFSLFFLVFAVIVGTDK